MDHGPLNGIGILDVAEIIVVGDPQGVNPPVLRHLHGFVDLVPIVSIVPIRDVPDVFGPSPVVGGSAVCVNQLRLDLLNLILNLLRFIQV